MRKIKFDKIKLRELYKFPIKKDEITLLGALAIPIYYFMAFLIGTIIFVLQSINIKKSKQEGFWSFDIKNNGMIILGYRVFILIICLTTIISVALTFLLDNEVLEKLKQQNLGLKTENDALKQINNLTIDISTSKEIKDWEKDCNSIGGTDFWDDGGWRDCLIIDYKIEDIPKFKLFCKIKGLKFKQSKKEISCFGNV